MLYNVIVSNTVLYYIITHVVIVSFIIRAIITMLILYLYIHTYKQIRALYNNYVLIQIKTA